MLTRNWSPDGDAGSFATRIRVPGGHPADSCARPRTVEVTSPPAARQVTVQRRVRPSQRSRLTRPAFTGTGTRSRTGAPSCWPEATSPTSRSPSPK